MCPGVDPCFRTPGTFAVLFNPTAVHPHVHVVKEKHHQEGQLQEPFPLPHRNCVKSRNIGNAGRKGLGRDSNISSCRAPTVLDRDISIMIQASTNFEKYFVLGTKTMFSTPKLPASILELVLLMQKKWDQEPGATPKCPSSAIIVLGPKLVKSCGKTI